MARHPRLRLLKGVLMALDPRLRLLNGTLLSFTRGYDCSAVFRWHDVRGHDCACIGNGPAMMTAQGHVVVLYLRLRLLTGTLCGDVTPMLDTASRKRDMRPRVQRQQIRIGRVHLACQRPRTGP